MGSTTYAFTQGLDYVSIVAASEKVAWDVLKAHWLEETQHTKSDMLEIAQLAREQSPEELSVAFDQITGIGGLVGATFVGQVAKEIDTIQQVTGRTFTDAEATTLRDTLYQSLSTIIAGVSLTHPSFTKVALELSKEGAAKIGIARMSVLSRQPKLGECSHGYPYCP